MYIVMSTFEEKMDALFERQGTSLYKVALSVGQDPSRAEKIIYLKRPTTFEKRLELLQILADSPLIDVDFGTMASWLAQEYLSKEVILKAAREVEEEAS